MVMVALSSSSSSSSYGAREDGWAGGYLFSYDETRACAIEKMSVKGHGRASSRYRKSRTYLWLNWTSWPTPGRYICSARKSISASVLSADPEQQVGVASRGVLLLRLGPKEGAG